MTESHRLPVLVVDDDRSILAVLQSWLSKAGWIPECHQDPLKALEAYSLRHHAAVVVDWHMPHLDGLELVGRLRAENQAQTAYVILVTSSEKSDLLDQAFEEGVDDFLRKPLDRQEFVARMKAARRVCLLDKEIRLRSEQDLERRMHAMALQRVSALAGALTHEIRTPLATVKLGVERLAAREAKSPTESHSIVSRLELAVNALAETMEDVLETFGMSHRTSRWGHFQPAKSLQEAVNFMQERVPPGVELILDIDPAAQAISGHGDAVGVRRLATNLLANALRHTSSGSVRLTLTPLADGFTLDALDTGEGIPPELLPWLGEPMLLNSENVGFGRYIRGNGMGLALCRKIVHRHQGTFAIRSMPGMGTRMTITMRLDLPGPASVEGQDNFYSQAGPP
ncbi:MAG: hybrid sensor histidine kinase/response regulator [Fibrobacteres bacterium]|jgi:two-component system sensor histidine kinase/response regulator|nr:hybrid sensor histidine kinase/response regulator [Fibrobacterota bacterium]